jgi:hypothetical protein
MTDALAGLQITMKYVQPLAIKRSEINDRFLTSPELGLSFKIMVRNLDSQRSAQIHDFDLDLKYAAEDNTSETQQFYNNLIYLSPLENYTFLVPVDFPGYAKNQSLPTVLGNWTIWVSYHISKIEWIFYGVVVETSLATYGLLLPFPFQIEVVSYGEYASQYYSEQASQGSSCYDKGGNICSANEGCSGTWINSRDGNGYCCYGVCVKPAGGSSNDYYESFSNYIQLAKALVRDNWQFLTTVLISLVVLLFGEGLLRGRWKKKRRGGTDRKEKKI